jgi:RecB family exonuclease
MYEDGMRIPPNPFVSLGLSVHRALEDFHTRKADSLDELFESYHRSWVNEGFVSPQQTQEFFERGQRMLENYQETYVNSKTEIIYVEKDFMFPLGVHQLRGIIDRIDRHPDGAFEVIDYKTHSEIWKQDKVDSDLQLSLYALACREALGITPDLLSYYFLAHNRKISTQRSEEQLKAAADLVQETAQKIMERRFSPNPGQCPKCDFRKSCVHSAAKDTINRKGRNEI